MNRFDVFQVEIFNALGINYVLSFNLSIHGKPFNEWNIKSDGVLYNCKFKLDFNEWKSLWTLQVDQFSRFQLFSPGIERLKSDKETLILHKFVPGCYD